MYILLFSAYLISGLIGAFLMEQGAFSLTFGYSGYHNGVTFFYLIHVLTTLLFLYLSSFIFKKIKFKTLKKEYSINKEGMKITFLLLLFFVVIWFFFGGIYVVLGDIDKTTFRVGLGPFGSIFFLILKSLIPVFCAYLSLLWLDNKHKLFSAPSLLLFCSLFMASLIALGAGFKALSILIVMPSLIFLLWRLNFRLLIFSLLLFICLIFLTLLFSKIKLNIFEAISFIFERATVLQGDVTWYVWMMPNKELNLFPMRSTIEGAIGGNMLRFLSESNVWVNYNYGAMLTEFIGRDPLGGFTVVGSSFLSAFLSFGKNFFFIYSAISGIIVSFFFFLMKACFYSRRYKLAALISTYNVFFVFSWIGGGDISKLIHISTMIYMILPYIVISVFISKKITIKHKAYN